MKSLVERLWPGGEFVSFGDIRSGDNIARAGGEAWGSLEVNCVQVGRATKLMVDESILRFHWAGDDDDSGVEVAFTEEEGDEPSWLWYYRFPLEGAGSTVVPGEEAVTVDALWTQAVVDRAGEFMTVSEFAADGKTVVDALVLVADVTEGGRWDGTGSFRPDVLLSNAQYEGGEWTYSDEGSRPTRTVFLSDGWGDSRTVFRVGL